MSLLGVRLGDDTNPFGNKSSSYSASKGPGGHLCCTTPGLEVLIRRRLKTAPREAADPVGHTKGTSD